MTYSPEPFVFALYNVQTRRFLVADRDGRECLIGFTKRADAEEFRDMLGVREHCDITYQAISSYPYDYFYLDEEFTDLDSTVHSLRLRSNE